jgi:heme/copper-type cytochrome/quinol oxidase subunit 3
MELTGFYSVSFYFLTALHAAHVLGGIIPMGFVTAASFRGIYVRTSHQGLHLLSMYWHFLDIVWLVLFTVLSLTLH